MAEFKESHKRILVLVSSVLVWYVSFAYVKMPVVRFLQPYFAGVEPGPKLFLDHLLIYGLIPALLCGLYWWFLVRKGLLEPLNLRTRLKHAIWDGILFGFLIAALTIPPAYYRWKFEFEFHPDFWKIAGNIFSNTYEEIQHRGLLLLAGLYAFRNKHVANLLGAVTFAYVHTQYPMELRVYVSVVGYFMGMAYLRTKNFVAPVIAHCIADWVLDSIFK